MSDENKRRQHEGFDIHAGSDNIEVAGVVQQDAVFGELTEGGPNYRSVSHATCLFRPLSKSSPD